MAKKKNDATPVCFCFDVSENEIRLAIHKGCKTLNDIRTVTMASTNCGRCTTDVVSILEDEKKKSRS